MGFYWGFRFCTINRFNKAETKNLYYCRINNLQKAPLRKLSWFENFVEAFGWVVGCDLQNIGAKVGGCQLLQVKIVYFDKPNVLVILHTQSR